MPYNSSTENMRQRDMAIRRMVPVKEKGKRKKTYAIVMIMMIVLRNETNVSVLFFVAGVVVVTVPYVHNIRAFDTFSFTSFK